MSGKLWSFFSASWLAIAAGPWESPSYARSWFDAVYYGLAAFGALMAISAALKTADRKQEE